jgi:hypothetical protein
MSAEIALWRAVVHRAFLDASQILENLKSGSERRRADQERRQARNWLSCSGADFVQVCLLANLDPGAVSDLALEVAGNRWCPVQGMAEMFVFCKTNDETDNVDERLLMDASYIYC